MTKEIATADYYEERDKVVSLLLKGEKETAISRSLGIPRKRVMEHIKGFHEYAKNNEMIQERGLQVVQEFDHQQDYIIRELIRSIEEADDNGDYKTKGVLLKTLHDVQKGRVDTMQKAGLLSDAAMGDEIAAMEEKHEAIIGILKKVTGKCPSCKIEIARELSRITGRPEPVVVDPE